MDGVPQPLHSSAAFVGCGNNQSGEGEGGTPNSSQSSQRLGRVLPRVHFYSLCFSKISSLTAVEVEPQLGF